MSPNYQKSKIYKIMSMNGENDDVYFGSTTQPLSWRMGEHRKKYKLWKEEKSNFMTSYNLFEKYGVENCIIALCENFYCNDVYELKAKEAEYIKNNPCVNKNIPNRTREEWCNANKNHLIEYNKKHREDKKEYYKQYLKEYCEKNKEKASLKASEKFVCICGATYTKQHELRHYGTKKHQNFINKEVI